MSFSNIPMLEFDWLGLSEFLLLQARTCVGPTTLYIRVVGNHISRFCVTIVDRRLSRVRFKRPDSLILLQIYSSLQGHLVARRLALVSQGFGHLYSSYAHALNGGHDKRHRIRSWLLCSSGRDGGFLSYASSCRSPCCSLLFSCSSFVVEGTSH